MHRVGIVRRPRDPFIAERLIALRDAKLETRGAGFPPEIGDQFLQADGFRERLGWVGSGQIGKQLKDEVEKYLTGESEPSELIYFKVYRSQLPVIEQALETAARMLGSDKSRGYCLEMICADFLAGVHIPKKDTA